MYPEIAARMKQLLESLSTSPGELAAKTGLSRGFVGEVCAGKKRPGVEFLQALTERYGVSASWVLVGNGPMLLSHTATHAHVMQPATGDAEKLERLARELFRENKREADRRYLGRISPVNFATYDEAEELLLALLERSPRNGHQLAEVVGFLRGILAGLPSEKRAPARTA